MRPTSRISCVEIMFFPVLLILCGPLKSQQISIATGADQTEAYFPFIKNKTVAIVANPTSQIAGISIVDSLLHAGIRVMKVFGPEHGFRGDASNGATVADSRDSLTGLPVVSLYGKKSQPSTEDLKDVDCVLFDIQDVGARFYTYILTLQRVMQACAENNKLLLVLDRPNPNGFYVDGPVLEDSLRSGVGGQPIPIVYGLTIGEMAAMINGEGWLKGGAKCNLKIIGLKGYTHESAYVLPVAPSPNLNTEQSILLYPTLCLFEGTVISQGRGTTKPFTVLGAPALKDKYPLIFTPVSRPGMSESPLYQDSACYGLDLGNFDTKTLRHSRQLNLTWLIDMYRDYPRKDAFFDYRRSRQIGNFDKLAGTRNLRKQIIAGTREEEIRASWEPALSRFKKKRKKYLLYPDFTP